MVAAREAEAAMISKSQMAIALPLAAHAGRLDVWYPLLAREMAVHEIDTEARQAMFLANLAEETGELAVQEENLHYSGPRLLQVFPSLFPGGIGQAAALAAQGPEAIANFIYADANRPVGYRMGNLRPGDGWKYRGRGSMQLTGHDNYARFFKSLGLPADSDPDLLLLPAFGARSAAHFWQTSGCNQRADAGDFVGAVKLVNGGTVNLDKRRRYLIAFQGALRRTDLAA
jgi:putative chitinase